jgi:scyllo-inositol 2-dehydrogenase (NADP+)
MKSNKYSVVIIGYGGMGSYHGKLINENASLEVIGTYDVLSARQEASADAGYPTYDSFEEVLNDPIVDIVLIATPNDSHKELSIRAMRAGKHIICEKPVTLSKSDFEELMDVANKTNRILMVHQNRRWDEDFLVIKALHNQETIGELFRIESRVQGANGIPGDWRHLEAHGGGMLLDWGVHLLDQLVFLIDSKIISISSRLSYILGDEVDDGFEAILEFENGVNALVEVGTTNFIQLPRWYVKGLEGTAIIEDWSLKGKIVKRNNDAVIIEPKPIKAGVGLTKTMAPPSEGATITEGLPSAYLQSSSFYDNLVAVIEGSAEPIVKNTEVLRVLNIIDVIFESSRTNQVVRDFDIYESISDHSESEILV